MAWTQAQLTALEEAIASGARRVKYADGEVEYNSITEMLALRDAMKRELNPARAGGFTLGIFGEG